MMRMAAEKAKVGFSAFVDMMVNQNKVIWNEIESVQRKQDKYDILKEQYEDLLCRVRKLENQGE